MIHRFAFIGFRHPHILSLWEAVSSRGDCRISAACEPDDGTRQQLKLAGRVEITHEDYGKMLAETDCDIVAVGDVYAQRGARIIAALEAGKHVISDKPICTTRPEWERIVKLSKEKNLAVGCQLDLIEAGAIRRLREVIRSDELGRICTITIGAQHPLRMDSRAAWYFKPGQHGGSINDIGVHAIDLASWLTGSPWEAFLFAREWNAKASQAPHFMDCAQFHGVLHQGASCFADVSYLAPDTLGYELPNYWRVTVHGTRGMAEASFSAPELTCVTDTDQSVRKLPGINASPAQYLSDFLQEIAGLPVDDGVTTRRVLEVSGLALEVQEIAGLARQAVEPRKRIVPPNRE